MVKVELFFDYACPFCDRAFKSLMELLPDYPEIEMVWHLCEVNPRSDGDYGRHSDLCIQSMFYAAENGVDMLAFHKKIFELFHRDRIDVGDMDVLADALKGLLDANGLLQALKSGKYVQKLREANDYAYEKSGVWVVPDFRMNQHKLVAQAGIGVPKEQLRAFLDLSQ